MEVCYWSKKELVFTSFDLKFENIFDQYTRNIYLSIGMVVQRCSATKKNSYVIAK